MTRSRYSTSTGSGYDGYSDASSSVTTITTIVTTVTGTNLNLEKNTTCQLDGNSVY